MKKRATSFVFHNFGFKVVALFISLILWLTILGRRDFVLNKDIPLKIQTGADMRVAAQTSDHIKVKVSGPRSSLKKFLDSPSTQGITIDVSQKGEGVVYVDIPMTKIEVPLGVRVIGVRPHQIQVEVVKEKDSGNGN